MEVCRRINASAASIEYFLVGGSGLEMSNDLQLGLDALVRSIGINKATPHALLLGAARQSLLVFLQRRVVYGNGSDHLLD